MQRREELLAKKAKLAELKRRNEQLSKELTADRQSIGAAVTRGNTQSPNRAETKQEVDELVSSLLGDEKGPSTPRSQTSPYGRDRSRPSSHVSPGKPESESSEAAGASPQSQTISALPQQTLSFAPLTTIYEIKSDVPRREVLVYSKGVQTSEPWTSDALSSLSDSDTEPGAPDKRLPRRRLSKKEREEELRQNIRREIEEELKVLRDRQPDTLLTDAANAQQNFPARTLTEEELDAVTSSNDFLDFVDRSSKVIERALDEEYDLLADYRLTKLAGADDEDEEVGTTGRKGRRVREILQFYDERWSRKRMISDIGFSSKFPELLLSAHTKDPSAPYDPPGVVLIWNQHMHSRPEYVFHATSDILTAKFSPFHPNLIIGGSYSGQVLLWDTRSRSPAPVQKTPLTGTGFGHTHPIYSINIVGTQNAHNIISTSTDGVLCSWSIDMLAQPQEYLELTTPAQHPSATTTATGASAASATVSTSIWSNPSARPDDLAPTCTAFPTSDPTYFLAGTEEGSIHLCHRYDRAGAKAGVDPHITYRGHAAPVMSLDFHSAAGPFDLGDLVLSTGLDWTVRLWRVRTPAATRIEVGAGPGTGAAGTGAKDVRPLLEMQRDDAVYDAKWSPVRPGVFATADGAGFLEVWDLNVETEVPVAKVSPSQRADAGVGASVGMGGGHDMGRRSLSKCAWEATEGRRLGCAGLDGVVTLFEVGAELGGLENVKQEEWMGVRKLVTRLEGR